MIFNFKKAVDPHNQVETDIPKLPDAPKQEKSESEKKADFTAIFGIFLIIFAVVGIITTVIFTSGLIYDTIDNKKLKHTLEEFLAPVVMNDPPPFDEISALDDTSIIVYAIWDLILNSDYTKYESNEFYIYVPAPDVEAHATALFGDEIKIRHKSVSDIDSPFEYTDAEGQDVYMVPASLQSISYNPKITAINKSNNTYILKVSYIQPGAVWGAHLEENKYKETAYKELQYTVEKTGKSSYKLTAIHTIDEPKTPDDTDSYEEIEVKSDITEEYIVPKLNSNSDNSSQ